MKIKPKKNASRIIAYLSLGTSLCCHHMEVLSMENPLFVLDELDCMGESLEFMEQQLYNEIEDYRFTINNKKNCIIPENYNRNVIDTGPAIDFPLIHYDYNPDKCNRKLPSRKNSLVIDERGCAENILRRLIASGCKKNNTFLDFPGHGSYVKQLVTLEFSKPYLNQNYPFYPNIECTFTTSFLVNQGEFMQLKKITGSLSKSLPASIGFTDAIISDVFIINKDISKEECLTSLDYYEKKKTTIHEGIVSHLYKNKKPLIEGDFIEFTLKDETTKIIEDIGITIGQEIPCLISNHIQHAFSGLVILPNVGPGLIDGKIVRSYSMNVPLLILAKVEIGNY